MPEILKEKLSVFLTEVLEREQAELVELKISRHSRGVSISVLVDMSGGISLDLCAKFNKEIRMFLEESSLDEDDVALEVSSPGLDRPLTTLRDFERMAGRTVDCYFSEKIEERMQIRGDIKEVIENNVVFLVKQKELEVPLKKINKAIQVIE